MASKNGPRPVGSDGFDFYHRQKVAPHYQSSSTNKSRLRLCIFVHFLLFLLMCAKLSEDILDRLDIFIMEVEELEIPKPLLWEYVWAGSLIFSFAGLSAARRNKTGSIKLYMFGTSFGNLGSVAFAAIYYFGEMWTYATTRDSSRLERWQGYPVAVLWYAFIVVALQVHSFSLYFAFKLLDAWQAARRGPKKEQ